jgi:cyclopropane fatty-acyl-phospholipid synthase-like methyltransferase
MPQITQGLRSVLSNPTVYRLFGQMIRKTSGGRTAFLREYVRPKTGDRLLDIGCGPGDIVQYLPEVEYVGFDSSQEYINSAQDRYGDRATFICKQVSTKTLEEQSSFDLVTAMGILHHLDEAEALQLFQLAQGALKPGGRLVTIDPCFVEKQSPVARYIISKDRGQNVRTQEAYLAIASQVFSTTAVSIRHDLLRIPYTHIILECTR